MMNNNKYKAVAVILLSLLGVSSGLSVAQTSDGPIPTEGDPEDFTGHSEPLRVVHILDEPRHRTVFKGERFTLLDVQINPGDTTLPHTYDGPILYTFISNGQGYLDGRLSSITRYLDEAYTHRVTNAGPGLFRIIALASFGPGLSEPSDDLPTGLEASDIELENPWFRAWRLTLEPGARHASITHTNPAFVVQVSPAGALHVKRQDGVTHELDAAGDWAAAMQAYELHNPGTEPVTLVIKEARQPR
ncbi:MAG TPA: hypothetical protein DEG76_05205 [Pseudohongiella sp.]|nr:hypothetical protein [Pseudohongiella sp.]